MGYRIYVEKKPKFAVDGGAVLADLNVALGIKTVENVRIINRYDCETLPKENRTACRFHCGIKQKTDGHCRTAALIQVRFLLRHFRSCRRPARDFPPPPP